MAKNDYNHLDKWIPAKIREFNDKHPKQERPLTLEQLANKAGISRTAIYRWMYDDDRPDEQNAAKICHVLKVPTTEIFAQYTPKKRGRPVGSGKGNPKEVRVKG